MRMRQNCFFAHIFFNVVDDDKRPVLLIIVVNIMIIMLNAVPCFTGKFDFVSQKPLLDATSSYKIHLMPLFRLHTNDSF